MLPIYLLMFVSFIAFALFGFCIFVAKLFKFLFPPPVTDFKKEIDKYQSRKRERKIGDGITNSLEEDVQRSCRLLEHLVVSKKIPLREYDRLRDFIDQQFAHLPRPKRILQSPLAGRDAELKTAATTGNSSELTKPPRFQIRDGVQPATVLNSEVLHSTSEQRSETPAPTVTAKRAQGTVPDLSQISSDSPTSKANDEVEGAGAGRDVVRDPWDIPDEPKRPERRKLTDVMASFMQERNIRWGELASGILIVGSAVGLVISLRNELTRTIPYFPALLFMLITAGIHLAGMYTLVKWKLRATSRGTLLIGLLLIPLNWLASCVISGGDAMRRPLSDPLYWLAISVGMIAFSVMTWWSSKLLFRKGNQWLTTGVMGAGAMTLFINRTQALDAVAGILVWLSLPLAVFFIVGTGLLGPPFATKKRWSARSLNRLYMMLGVAVFSTLSALSLVFVRSSDYTLVLTAFGPLFVFLSVTLVWVGLIARTGFRDGLGSGKGNAADAVEPRIHSTVGNALAVLGSLASLFSIAYFSAGNPGVFVIANAIAAFSFGWMAFRLKTPWLFSLVWLGVGAAVVTGVSQTNAVFNLDQISGWQVLSQNLISAEVGLAVMAIGVSAIAIGFSLNTWMSQRFWATSESGSLGFLPVHLLSGSLAVGIGCCLALVAALVNQESVFDTMTASVLLAIATIGGLIGSMTGKWGQGLALLVCSTGMICLAFSFQLNPTLVQLLNSLLSTGHAGVRWLFVLVAYSVLLTGACVSMSRKNACDKLALHTYVWFANGAIVLAAVGCVGLMSSSFPWVIHSMGIICCVSFALAWAARDLTAESQFVGRMLVVSSTVCLASLALSEYGGRFDLPRMREPAFWLIMANVWALLATAWALFSRFAGNSKRWGWLLSQDTLRPELAVLLLSFSGWAVLVLVGFVESVSHELFRDAELGRIRLSEFSPVLISGVAIMFVAVVVAGIRKKQESLIWWMALQFIWTVGWVAMGIGFDNTQSFATSTRWLTSIACVVTATLALACKGWFAEQNKHFPITQPQLTSVLNTYLVLSVGVVLLISTFTVGRVLLTSAGAAALGGPETGSLLARIPKEISFGVPAGLITASLLMFAIAEKRQWLATAGSAIYQYVVVLAIGMLFLSPHPKLATEWFVNILQVVSVGMSCYGLIWYRYRQQMEVANTGLENTGLDNLDSPRQIEIHTVINIVLVSSLAVLIYGRTFHAPAAVGDWTNSVGGLLGWTSLVLVSLQAWFVFGERTELRASRVSFLFGWAGLIVVAMAAASVDRFLVMPLYGLRTIVWGSVILLGVQFGCQLILNRWSAQSASNGMGTLTNGLVFLISGIILAYAVRGGLLDGNAAASYLASIVCVIVLVTWMGVTTNTASTQLSSLAGVGAIVLIVLDVSPWGYVINGAQAVSLLIGLSLVLSCIWAIAYVIDPDRGRLGRRFLWVPNLVPWCATGWVVLMSLGEMLFAAFGARGTRLLDPYGVGMVGLVCINLTVNTWHTRTRLQLLCKFAATMAIPILVACWWLPQTGVPRESYFVVFGMLAAAVVVVWGILWRMRDRLVRVGEAWGVSAIDRKIDAAHGQLPIYAILTGLVVAIVSATFLYSFEFPIYRYLAAMAPGIWAIGMAGLAEPRKPNVGAARGWIQVLTLSVLTGSAVLTSWAGLAPSELAEFKVGAQMRLVMVLSSATFVYGMFVSRWVREEDSWLVSLRNMMCATCVAAMFSIVGLVWAEMWCFNTQGAVEIDLGSAIGSSVLILGMVCGLVLVALKPKRDPFAFSETGRRVYVYAAQFVLALLCAHLYFSMPFLFQFGIQQYWPYLVMLLAFGGVGIAHALRARQLEVLAQPLFNTAVTLPVLASLAVGMVDSQADPSLVLLIGGMLYLLLGYTKQSLLSGGLAIVLGNLALWTFYGNFSEFAFESHPQLWLIPPAFSVLIGGHIARDRFTAGQSATLRYLCVAIIYISSTSEVFISGLGDQLWPPMILALLSIAGIVTGIALQVRAYLYLGATFLLMAMVTMISHAHQQLGHVWPWWAFGVVLGIMILVMFGLFEKKRNEMRAITGQLKQWEL